MPVSHTGIYYHPQSSILPFQNYRYLPVITLLIYLIGPFPPDLIPPHFANVAVIRAGGKRAGGKSIPASMLHFYSRVSPIFDEKSVFVPIWAISNNKNTRESRVESSAKIENFGYRTHVAVIRAGGIKGIRSGGKRADKVSLHCYDIFSV